MRTHQIHYIVILITLFLSGCSADKNNLFSPDRIWNDEANRLLVANRGSKELWLMDSSLKSIIAKTILPSAVNGLEKFSNKLWVVCGGNEGVLYELHPENLSVLSQTKLGHTPSSLVYNQETKSLWITHRFNNELWEVNPDNLETISRINVGREPISVLSFREDSLLLVANNLPEMEATIYPVACQLDIVDVNKKGIVKRLLLPNGSTDVKAVTTDSNREYAYIVHLLARYQLPTNQVDRGWMSTNALTIVNLATCEIENTVLLDTPQRGAANPWDIALSPNNDQIWVAVAGTHELVCIDRELLHNRLEKVKNGKKATPSTIDWEHIPNDAGFLYGIREFFPTTGKGPRSLCVTAHGVYATNYYTGEVIQMDTDGNLITKFSSGTPLISSLAGKGDLYFHDATIGFQQWQSCASCHPNDARMDGLNWDLLNDGMGNPKNTKSLLFSHKTPPCMATGIRENAEAAVRSGIKYILFAELNEGIAAAMDAYLKSLSPVTSPYVLNGKLSESATRGKESFDNHCISCHSGTYYTDCKQYLIEWANETEQQVQMDVPALNEIWRTAPYLYDGKCKTIREMLKIHGPKELLSDKELDDLAEYILSL